MQGEDIKADLKMQPDQMFQATIARHYRFTEIEQRSYFGKCYMSHFTECSQTVRRLRIMKRPDLRNYCRQIHTTAFIEVHFFTQLSRVPVSLH
jgi:LPS sulfotransferase NodH